MIFTKKLRILIEYINLKQKQAETVFSFNFFLHYITIVYQYQIITTMVYYKMPPLFI